MLAKFVVEFLDALGSLESILESHVRVSDGFEIWATNA